MMQNQKMNMSHISNLPYFDKMKQPPHGSHHQQQEMMMFPGMQKNYFPGMGLPYQMPGMFMNPYMRNMPMHQPPMFPNPKLNNPKKLISYMAKNFTMQEKIKEKEKPAKKEEDANKVLNLVQPAVLVEIFKSLQISLKNGQELQFYNICKRILSDLEGKAKEKKLKTLSKEISDFLTTLHEKMKAEIHDKKDKKKSSSSVEHKISEYELMKILHESNNSYEILSLVNLEKSKIEHAFPPDACEITGSEENMHLFEEAKNMFKTGLDKFKKANN